jgi:hypothetical protein
MKFVRLVFRERHPRKKKGSYVIADERKDTHNHIITNPCNVIRELLIDGSNSKGIMDYSQTAVAILTVNSRNVQCYICQELMEACGIFHSNWKPTFSEAFESGILACVHWINNIGLAQLCLLVLSSETIIEIVFTLIHQPQLTLVHLNRVTDEWINAAST